MPTDTQSKYIVPIAIVAAGLLIAGAVYLSAGKNTSVPVIADNNPSIANVDMQGEPFIGDSNAPVTLAYWLDFQCPFCQRFDLQTLPMIVDNYVKIGKLKIVFKDFQFLGADSQDAGLAAKAVWELYPKSYFKWHQTMFNAQDGENSGFGDINSIIQLIRKETPEIDADKIAKHVQEKRSEYQQEQDADKAEGGSFGISGTPGFVIGSQTISGAQPINVFTQLIDAELNN
ncbi:MAG: thioredoxin domain-containing protein [Candidatus Nealsonbacteria bacterium]|nr:thioredoxin domain-containing protein [Candidatus Nealsonbacteria bacterium]